MNARAESDPHADGFRDPVGGGLGKRRRLRSGRKFLFGRAEIESRLRTRFVLTRE